MCFRSDSDLLAEIHYPTGRPSRVAVVRTGQLPLWVDRDALGHVAAPASGDCRQDLVAVEVDDGDTATEEIRDVEPRAIGGDGQAPKGSLVGQKGVTVTALRPAGMAIVNDRKVDVVLVGEFIDKDVDIAVVDVSGNRVVVRPDRDEEQ